MPQQFVTAAEFRKTQKGSRTSHEGLVSASRLKLTLAGIPCFTIHTRGIPRLIRGEIVFCKNPFQIGLPDAIALIHHRCPSCGHATGRLVLLEMKTGAARRSPGQVKVRKTFEAKGALALVIRSLDDVDAIIEADLKARREPWQRNN